jgi:predicted ABC-type sugar transport system permease subunit
MTTSDNNTPQDGAPGPPLFAIAEDAVYLLQQELRLARQETIENLTPAAQGGGMILAGGVAAAVGSRYVSDAIVRLLATMMPHWLASLIFGAGLTAGGLVLMRRGSAEIKNIDLVPEKTINSLREDTAWLLRQIKSRLI